MNEQKTEFLDERSKEKMKRAKKFEKRIKRKKIIKLYPNEKGGRFNV